MKEVWSNDTPRFSGNFVQIEQALYFAPKPLQRPHPPIWVGGESTSALKRVVEFGDGWHIGLIGLEAIKPKFAQLRVLMAAAGRDFSHLEITSMVDNRALSATEVRAYRDIGVTGLYVVAPGPDPKSVLSLMREFAKKVQDALS
jgi:alkanesulfonate monooxygenase SsuD/methylene tetrahydromethanopterin reductase-like flavin-dependent oxidoreductase (luciferase family)